MDSLVTVSLDEGVVLVTVDNPPVNALCGGVLSELGEVAASLAGDDELRAVVVTGAGERSILAGADLTEYADWLGDDAAMGQHVRLTEAVFGEWERIEVPVVAALGGHALGGGLEFALVCDLIVADPRVRLGLPEVTLGLMPGAGGSQRLPRRVGLSAARRMLLVGDLLDAETAHALGLVDIVASEGRVLDDALGLARRVAGLPAVAVRAGKQAIRAASTTPLGQGLQVERELFLRVAASSDAREGATAFLEKRRPRFSHS